MPGAELYLYRDEGGTHLRGSHPHPHPLTQPSRACATPAATPALHVPASPPGFEPLRGGRGHHTRTRVLCALTRTCTCSCTYLLTYVP